MTFQINEWTAVDYASFRQTLFAAAEPEYKKFQEGLCKTSRAEILGVRMPKIKKIAAEILKGDALSFLSVCENEFYEEIMTEGLVTAGIRLPFAEKKKYIDLFLPKIDNWAVCDSVCSALKINAADEKEAFEYFKEYALSKDEYAIRFGTVMLMLRFIKKEYISELFHVFSKIDCSYYYTSMAVAWSVSYCFAEFKTETAEFLKSGRLDKETHNRAIRKICESLRTSKSDKEKIKRLKR